MKKIFYIVSVILVLMVWTIYFLDTEGGEQQVNEERKTNSQPKIDNRAVKYKEHSVSKNASVVVRKRRKRNVKRKELFMAEATVRIQSYIQTLLKTKCKFPWTFAVHLNGNLYKYNSYFYAENIFGAKIRHNFRCVITYYKDRYGDAYWKLESFSLD